MNGSNFVPDRQNLLVVSTGTIQQAKKRIYSCKQCCPADAEIRFDWILDEITGSDSTITDYVMESPAICPLCCRDIFEKTLVEAID
jgi:hypothetical protein